MVASDRSAHMRAAPAPWTFLTNHAHVLFCLSRDPEVRMRDVAVAVGVTERAVQRIVAELEDAGYLRREKTGRRNHYKLQTERPLRHPNSTAWRQTCSPYSASAGRRDEQPP
jgi:predicted DNA-binding transcriptional regulator